MSAPRAAVIGGGIAGLAAAWDLRRAGVDTRVLEASNRVGGKVRTAKAGGLAVEAGPDSFLTAKPDALQLVKELGLTHSVVEASSEDKDVFVYARGRLRRFPDGLMLLGPTRWGPFLSSDLVTWPGKLRMALDLLIPPGPRGDESLAAFTRRRLGQEALETIVDPVMAGIFAGDPEQLSLSATFPQLAELEAEHGGVLRGLRAARRARLPGGGSMFATLQGGLEELIDALVKAIGPGVVRLDAPVSTIAVDGTGFRVRLDSGEGLGADAVVVAAPARSAARMLEALDGELAGQLRRIPFSSTATVSLAYPAAASSDVPRGFGFVVPRGAGRVVTAATFTSFKFPGKTPADTFLVRCFVGGAGREGPLDLPDEKLVASVRDDLAEIAGLRREPRATWVFRWPEANPQYNVGHRALVAAIDARVARWPGLFLAGASYCGVGIPDCIKSGRAAAVSLSCFLGQPTL